MGILQNVVRDRLAVEEKVGGPPGTVLEAAVADREGEAVRTALGLSSAQLVCNGPTKGLDHVDEGRAANGIGGIRSGRSCRSLHETSLLMLKTKT